MDGFPPVMFGEMKCPMCGFDCTHVSFGNDVRGDYPDSGHKGFNPRSGFIRLNGYCEDGCTFEILIGQHKGTTQVVTHGKSWEEALCEGVAFDSEVERKFWIAAKSRPQFHKLVAQHSVQANGSEYRLDFAIPSRSLAIEVDGLAYHNGQDSFIKDRNRQRDLEMEGWRVLRFAAKEVMVDPAKCVNQAAEWASKA